MHSFLCTFKAFNIVSHFNDHGPTNQGSEISKKMDWKKSPGEFQVMYVLRTVLTRRIGTFFFLTRTFSQEASIETMDWHLFWSGIVTFIQLYLSRLSSIKIRIQPNALSKVVHPTYDASLLKVYNPAGSLAHSSAPYIVVVYNVQFHLFGMAIRLILLALRWEKIYLNQTNGHPLSFIALLRMKKGLDHGSS